MGFSDLDPEKQKKYDELKKKYLKKPKTETPEKQIQPESYDDKGAWINENTTTALR